MLDIVYHPKYLQYNFGLGHPFWPERAEKFLEILKEKNIKHKIHEPGPAADQDILLAHSQEYLKKVKHLAKTDGALSIDTPINDKILEAAFYHTGGTILATKLTLKGNKVINLLGGLHHAGIQDSSGFCVFNDHAVAIKKLQQEKIIKKAFVFDVDVHAGQGTQEIFYTDPTVFTLSIHQDPRTLYPGTGFPSQTGKGKGKGFNKNIILPPGSDESYFLKSVDEGLALHKKFDPQLTVLVFGADTYKEDPLAQIKLDISTYRKLGEKLKKIKNLCLLCAGGYSRKVPDIWLSLLEGLSWLR